MLNITGTLIWDELNTTQLKAVLQKRIMFFGIALFSVLTLCVAAQASGKYETTR